MRFSEAWLREWVNPKLTTQELVDQITMAGLEVDAFEPVAADFTGVIVGEVVECGQHPNADKLSLCQVFDGKANHQVICGAPNVRQGLKVAFATIGAALPDPKGGDKPFKIKKAKLRDVESHGMLCSGKELGLSDDHDGIMELPANAEVGVDFRGFMGLNDQAIEVDLTPNRADCLGMIGLAREVGVLNKLDVEEVAETHCAPSIDDTFPIKVSAPADCPRYLGRVVKDVNIAAETPLWMQERLRRSGLRSIDPIVDVTNYVLLELGQPLHGFDLAKLNGEINVRRAENGEKLTLLDGAEVELKDNTLVIADNNGPLAIAGIMGGEQSGCSAETKDILIECAFFNPISIAGRARQYGLHTDSSHRFERGVDYGLQTRAIERATELVLEIAGGQPGPIVGVESDEHLPKVATIELREARLAQALGLEIPKAEVTEILTRLGMDVNEIEGGWGGIAPTYRFDMSIEEDLIEEVARVYGYNNIPTRAPATPIIMDRDNEKQMNVREVRRHLIARGYQEAVTYSFVDARSQKQFDPSIDGLALANPISSDLAVMRTSLLPGLVKTLQHNLNRQQSRVRIFETGLRFLPGSTDEKAVAGLSQEQTIAGLISGSRAPKGWTADNEAVDFYDLKSDVEALLERLAGAENYRFEKGEHSALHPGQTAALYKGDELVGYLGKLHPVLQGELGLKQDAYVFELSLTTLLEGELPAFAPLSNQPAVTRDLAVVVNEEIQLAQVDQIIRKQAGEYLTDLTLFDVYRGKGIENNRKSLAMGLTWQHPSRTLNDEEINQAFDACIKSLESEVNAQLRG